MQVFGQAGRVALWFTMMALVVPGCASGGGGPAGPVVSPTGIVYPPGIQPTETRHSQTATLYLRSDEPERALNLALEGIEAEPENPIHYFLAGVAHARVGELETADAMFVRAEELYPAYELQIEPERASAWGEAFNRGADAYAEGDVDEAIRAWSGAAAIYDLRPEAHRNLAMVLAGEGRYEEVAEAYRDALTGLANRPSTRVLDDAEIRQREADVRRLEESLAEVLLMLERFTDAEPLLRTQLENNPNDPRVRQNLALALAGQGKRAEAGEIYDDLLSGDELEATQLFTLGVALFRSADYQRAAEAFGRLTELRPQSRDAWFNYANALFAAEAWEPLLRVGATLMELDPLNESAGLIAARAHLEMGDEERALEGLERIDAAPVYLEGLVLRPAVSETSLQGRVTGNESDAGLPVELRFTFYGEEGELGAEILVVSAPPPGESEAFEISLDTRATWYRYEVVGMRP